MHFLIFLLYLFFSHRFFFTVIVIERILLQNLLECLLYFVSYKLEVCCCFFFFFSFCHFIFIQKEIAGCLTLSSKNLKICPERDYICVVIYLFPPTLPLPLPCHMWCRHPFAALKFIGPRCSCAEPPLGGNSWSTLTAGKVALYHRGHRKDDIMVFCSRWGSRFVYV